MISEVAIAATSTRRYFDWLEQKLGEVLGLEMVAQKAVEELSAKACWMKLE